MNFVNSFESEWLKRKRSLASWLVIVGAFLPPFIILITRIVNTDQLAALYVSSNFWEKLWNKNWEPMVLFLLPMGIILATSLVTQVEYKNNTWKQLHTTPQKFSTIFFAKLLVILTMLVEAFVLFNVGIYLSAIIPSILFSNIPYPNAPIPYAAILYSTIIFFIDCLPIVALQYLISLQFKNFLVPIGIGFAVWVLGVFLLPWEYNYIVPYIYGAIDFLMITNQLVDVKIPPISVHLLSIIYFTVITMTSYILYITKREKG